MKTKAETIRKEATMFRLNRSGFTFVEIIVAVVILAAVGFAGYRVYDASQSSEETDESTTNTQVEENTNQAPEVNEASDLNEAEAFINEVEIDEELDTSELDNALTE